MRQLMRQPMNRFEKKIALITGGSRGIGAGVAKRLAAEGAEVIITYAASKEKADEVVKDIAQNGGSAHSLKADATNPAAMTELADTVLTKYGQPNILVNNAGIFEGGTLEGISETALDKTLNVNVKSLFLLTQLMTKHMESDGRIINIGSCLGERATFAGASPYNMSKFAVSGLTRSWAWDLAERKITVNAVLPGPIATDMGDPNAAGITALKRLGTVDEVASAVAFLASDEASFITGAQLEVDGGANA